jgi:hypothetical protein
MKNSVRRRFLSVRQFVEAGAFPDEKMWRWVFWPLVEIIKENSISSKTLPNSINELSIDFELFTDGNPPTG